MFPMKNLARKGLITKDIDALGRLGASTNGRKVLTKFSRDTVVAAPKNQNDKCIYFN